MNSRTLIVTTLFVALILAGCQNSGQQTPQHDSGAPATAEQATLVEEKSIQPVNAEILASASQTGSICAFDSVDGNYFLNQVKLIKGRPHVFRGWLADEVKHPAGEFSFVLEGQQNFAIPVATGVVRSDVGDYFKDPSLAAAGYNFSTMLNSVPSGEYKATLVFHRGGRVYSCDTGKKFIVE
jgi:hypothetical protein